MVAIWQHVLFPCIFAHFFQHLNAEFKDIQQQREKSDRFVIESFFPDSIAGQLRDSKPESIADGFEKYYHSVLLLILWVLQGMPAICRQVNSWPCWMKFSVNSCFGRQIWSRKIKTIGDSYLAVGGLPSLMKSLPGHCGYGIGNEPGYQGKIYGQTLNLP